MSLEIVYVHFPKAAGTSLVHSLRSHYGESLVADNTHLPPYDWSHDPAHVAGGVRAVFGHFHADRYAMYREAFRFTFLREPVDNLISIFYFWRTFPPSGYAAHERFLSEKPTIFAFATYPEIQRLASQCYFGGVDMDGLDFVGFFEHRTGDMLRLSTRLGFHVSPDVVINRTSPEFADERADLKANDRAMAKLRDLLADDVAFYERAYERRT
jgi:hypothetical protein